MVSGTTSPCCRYIKQQTCSLEKRRRLFNISNKIQLGNLKQKKNIKTQYIKSNRREVPNMKQVGFMVESYRI